MPGRLRWTKGQRGNAPRTTECGVYVVEIVEHGDRHSRGPFWAARLAEPGPDGRFLSSGVDLPG